MWRKNLKLHKKILKQAMRKTERDAKKTREIERMQYLQFAEMEKLNLMPLARETKNKPLQKWTQYQQEKYPSERWHQDFIENDNNIAVVCGETSGNLTIVDCDKPKLAQKIFGNDIKDRTFCVETGGDPKGRRQVYFKLDYPVRGRKFHDLRIEILGQGNYAVYPPSTHPLTGRKYKALKTTPIASIEGDFMEEFFTMLKATFGNKFKPEKYRETINIDDLLQGVQHGERDDAAVKIVNWLRQANIKEEDAEAYLREWNEKNYDIMDGKKTADPLPDEVINDKIRRCYMRQEAYGYKFNRIYVPETVYSKEVKEKARKILAEGNPFTTFNEAVALLHAGDTDLIQIQWISLLSSRVTPKVKINLWQIGKSQVGKSHSMYSTLHGAPKEYYEIFTSSSPLSFFYYIKKYGEWSLDKKLIYVDEVEASKQALPMLRTLTGQTDITPRHLSVHEAEVLDLQIKGKRSVWFTSVKTFGTPQIKNRFTHLNPDESPVQDERVFDIQIDEYWDNTKINQEPLLVAQAMTQMIARETEKLKVKKPFKPAWPFKRRRWLFPIFVMFVDTIAKINYKQRKIEDEYIIAQKEDIEKAKQLWQAHQKSIIYRVSESAQTIYELLPDDAENAITHVEIGEQIGISTRQTHNLCKELIDEGLANSRKRSGGYHSWEYWKSKIPDFNTVGVVSQRSNQRKTVVITKSKKDKKVKMKKHPENDFRISTVSNEFAEMLWGDKRGKKKDA